MESTINILFSVLFVASTAVNIFVSLRITKAEGEQKEWTNGRLKEETIDLITRRELQREIELLRREVETGNENLQKQLDRKTSN